MKRLNFSFSHAALYSSKEDSEALSLAPYNSNADRSFQYDICTALDMTRMSIVLNKLVDYGMNPRVAELYHDQASALLAQLLSEKNRIVLEREKERKLSGS